MGREFYFEASCLSLSTFDTPGLILVRLKHTYEVECRDIELVPVQQIPQQRQLVPVTMVEQGMRVKFLDAEWRRA